MDTRGQVRAVQRRLGMLGCASDLSEEFKEELRDIRKALKQQGVCNVAIDGVVSDEVIGGRPFPVTVTAESRDKMK